MDLAMTKPDLRQRVYHAADELFIERGTLEGFGYREVRQRAGGASNDVMGLLDDWRASRLLLMRERPEALAAMADEIAGRLWLMARLLAGAEPSGAALPRSAKAGASAPAKPAKGLAVRPAAPAPPPRPIGKGPKGQTLFSDMARPVRDKPDPEIEKKRAAAAERAAQRASDGPTVVLVPLPPKQLPALLTDADWQGAAIPETTKAIARVLRKKGDRMRATPIWHALRKAERPGTKQHAAADFKAAVEGSNVEWSPGGWFWFTGEPLPVQVERRNTKKAAERHKGDPLWWQIAYTIAALGRPFTLAEFEQACGRKLADFGESWLRIKLLRARERKPPFVKLVSPGVMEWTGLDPEKVVIKLTP